MGEDVGMGVGEGVDEGVGEGVDGLLVDKERYSNHIASIRSFCKGVNSSVQLIHTKKKRIVMN